MQLRNITFSSLLFLLFITQSSAQIADTSYNGVNDPFSYYGVGTVMFDGLQSAAMMGHTGTAHQSVYIVNTANPASLANIRLTTADFSLQGLSSTASSKEQTETSGSFRPSYFYLSYPVGKKAGMTLGIDQKLSTLYRIRNSYQQPVGDTSLNATQQWVGNGSMNFINISGAYRWGGLNIGLRLDYNFGNRQTENYLTFTDSFMIYGSDLVSTVEYRGFGTELGLQYAYLLTPDSSKKITIGAVYGLRANLKATKESYATNFFYQNNRRIDTFEVIDGNSDNYSGPSKLSIGLGYKYKNKLQILADYTSLTFDDAYLLGDSLTIGNFTKFSSGVSYTPNQENGKGAFSKSTYSAGFYTGTDYMRVNDNPVNFWGITGGISLPFGRNLSLLHLGIEYGSRGTVADNRLRLRNTVYSIGISFSDLWFQKRYYN